MTKPEKQITNLGEIDIFGSLEGVTCGYIQELE